MSVLIALVAAKLVIATANGVAVTDYPSLERCEVAKAALEAAWLKQQQADVPKGYRLVKPAPLSAVCIPA